MRPYTQRGICSWLVLLILLVLLAFRVAMIDDIYV